MKSIAKVESAGAIASSICGVELVNRWLSFAGVASKSEETYRGNIKQLFLYLQSRGISQPARADLEAWRDSLIESGKAASTVCGYMTAAKLFFRFLAQEGIYPNIADHLKSKLKVNPNIHKRDALSDKQAKDLQRAIGGKDLKNLRDRAIVALALGTGARSIEIVRADFQDLRTIEGRNVLFLQRKRHCEKDSFVVLSDKVYSYIQQYLKARAKAAGKKIGRSEPLFVSTSNRNKNARLDTQSLRKMVKSKLRNCGWDSVFLSFHSLRHTACTAMIRAGQNLQDVRLAMAHSNVNTTLIYFHTFNRLKAPAEIAAAEKLII